MVSRIRPADGWKMRPAERTRDRLISYTAWNFLIASSPFEKSTEQNKMKPLGFKVPKELQATADVQ